LKANFIQTNLSYPQRSAQLFDIMVDWAPLSTNAWNEV